jgi:hypothetical protein
VSRNGRGRFPQYRPPNGAEGGFPRVPAGYPGDYPPGAGLPNVGTFVPPSGNLDSRWQPSEAEIARWGGEVVLYGKGFAEPINKTPPLPAEQGIFDATVPVPMPMFLGFSWEWVGGPGVVWTTGVLLTWRIGVGRASLRFDLPIPPGGNPNPPPLPPFFAPVPQAPIAPVRQVTVTAAWTADPQAGEAIKVGASMAPIRL